MKCFSGLAIILAMACGGASPGTEEGEGAGSASSEGSQGSETTTGGTTAAESSVDGTTEETTDETGQTTDTGESGGSTTTGDLDEGASPGCGGDPSAIPPTLEIDGKEREFIVALPEDYDHDHLYSLIFAWHAAGTDGALARSYYQVEESSAGKAIVVYPDGLPTPEGQTGWDLDADGYDLVFFDELYEQLTDNLCIDLDRVFSTGHSFGGFMSNSVGCYRGDLIRAIAPVAGGGPTGTGVCRGSVAAWIAHGKVDGIVSISMGEDSRDHWLHENTCGEVNRPTTPSPCVIYPGCNEGYPVVWCAHEEVGSDGHLWPTWAGPAIWSFFDSI